MMCSNQGFPTKKDALTEVKIPSIPSNKEIYKVDRTLKYDHYEW